MLLAKEVLFYFPLFFSNYSHLRLGLSDHSVELQCVRVLNLGSPSLSSSCSAVSWLYTGVAPFEYISPSSQISENSSSTSHDKRHGGALPVVLVLRQSGLLTVLDPVSEAEVYLAFTSLSSYAHAFIARCVLEKVSKMSGFTHSIPTSLNL